MDALNYEDLKIFHEGEDYLTIKLPNNAPIIEELNAMNFETSYPLGFANLTIKYAGLVAGSQLKVYYIHNNEFTAKGELQQIACVHIKQDVGKKNRNFNTDIELVGKFWNFYKEYADDFYRVFNIDVRKNDILTRADYCFDIMGLTVDEVYERLKDNTKKMKCNEKHEYDIPTESYNKQKTWFLIKGDRHNIAVYDKKYQILSEKKYEEKIGGIQVYKNYLEQDEPITRIEYRKNARAFEDFENNSIEETLKQLRNMAIAHIRKKFDIDVMLMIDDYKQTIRYKTARKDDLNIGLAKDKSRTYINRGLSYINSYACLNSEKELFRQLDMIYGQRIRKHFLKEFIQEKKTQFQAKRVFGQVY